MPEENQQNKARPTTGLNNPDRLRFPDERTQPRTKSDDSTQRPPQKPSPTLSEGNMPPSSRTDRQNDERQQSSENTASSRLPQRESPQATRQQRPADQRAEKNQQTKPATDRAEDLAKREAKRWIIRTAPVWIPTVLWFLFWGGIILFVLGIISYILAVLDINCKILSWAGGSIWTKAKISTCTAYTFLIGDLSQIGTVIKTIDVVTLETGEKINTTLNHIASIQPSQDGQLHQLAFNISLQGQMIGMHLVDNVRTAITAIGSFFRFG